MRIRELRAGARESLKGNWNKLAIPLLIMFLITLPITYLFQFYIRSGICNDMITIISFAVFYVLIILFSIIFSYGIIITSIKIARKEEVNFLHDTIANYKDALKIAWNIFLKAIPFILIIIIGIAFFFFSIFFANGINEYLSPLLIVLGFIIVIYSLIRLMILAYEYFLVYYLKYDYNNKDMKELLEKSKMLMKGNIAKILVMPLTFFGWMILAYIPSIIAQIVLNIIWPPIIFFNEFVPTAPFWASLIAECFSFFMVYVSSYMQMTLYHFYMDQKPLEIYNEGYEKPKTNSKKYILILSAVFIIPWLLCVIGTLLLFQSGMLINNLPPM
jgi:uncharacterized membrane protein